MAEVFMDFGADPGLQACDRCHRIVLCQWFSAMLLCQNCLNFKAEKLDLIDIVGVDALAASAERLSAMQHQLDEARRSLKEVVQFMSGFLERGAERTAKIEQLLEGVLNG